jgi:hypothetical protein
MGRGVRTCFLPFFGVCVVVPEAKDDAISSGELGPAGDCVHHLLRGEEYGELVLDEVGFTLEVQILLDLVPQGSVGYWRVAGMCEVQSRVAGGCGVQSRVAGV